MVRHKVVPAVMLISLIAACGPAARPSVGAEGPSEDAGWNKLSQSPLSPRRSAHAFSVDGKLLIMGGTEAAPCPPGADCVEPTEAPRSDGASYGPATGAWTVLSEAPAPLGFGTGAVAGGRVYLLISEYGSSHPSVRRAFLSYDPVRDEWSELELPPNDPSLMLAAAGDDVIAYQESQENGVEADLLYDATARTWSELPADPLRPSFDRSMVWTDAGVVLLGIEVVPNPGSESPSFYRAAILDDAGRWRRLADSEVIGWNPLWAFSSGRVVNASIESADGGEVNPWGRSYPAGGSVDPFEGEWFELPNVPEAHGEFTGIYAMGNRGVVTGGGWVFDTADQEWLHLTRPDGRPRRRPPPRGWGTCCSCGEEFASTAPRARF